MNEILIGISIWNMSYQYGTWYIDMVDDMVIYHIDRHGIWANDMGDDNIDKVISHIDMGYLVTLVGTTNIARHVSETHFEPSFR